MLRSPDRTFWLTAALSAAAVTAFCFSSWAIAPDWWTASRHGITILTYGSLLLRLAPRPIDWPTKCILMLSGFAAPCLVFIFTVLPLWFFPAPIASCALAMFMFVGLPLNLAYMSWMPGVVAFVVGLGAIPLLFAVRWLLPAFFGTLFDDAMISALSSTLHLGVIAAITFGHANAVYRKQHRRSSLCRNRGYELAGLNGQVCPECGTQAESLTMDPTAQATTPKL